MVGRPLMQPLERGSHAARVLKHAPEQGMDALRLHVKVRPMPDARLNVLGSSLTDEIPIWLIGELGARECGRQIRVPYRRPRVPACLCADEPDQRAQHRRGPIKPRERQLAIHRLERRVEALHLELDILSGERLEGRGARFVARARCLARCNGRGDGGRRVAEFGPHFGAIRCGGGSSTIGSSCDSCDSCDRQMGERHAAPWQPTHLGQNLGELKKRPGGR